MAMRDDPTKQLRASALHMAFGRLPDDVVGGHRARRVVLAMRRATEELDALPRDERIRRLAWRTERSRIFQVLMGLIVSANTLFLVLESPHAWYAPRVRWITGYGRSVSLAIVVAFTLEAGVKATARRRQYVRSLWTCLDLAVIICGWLEVIMTSALPGSRPVISVLHAVRALPVLRSVRAVPAMHHIAQCIFVALLDIGHVALLLCVLVLTAGLIALSIFGAEAASEAGETALGTFDNVGVAMTTVFQCITGEGWAEVMYDAMDAFHPASWLYFVALLVVASWIGLNLFVAVLAEAHRRLLDEGPAVNAGRPHRPPEAWRLPIIGPGRLRGLRPISMSAPSRLGQGCARWVKAAWFRGAVAVCALAHAAALLMDGPYVAADTKAVLRTIHRTATCLVAVELAVRLGAQGAHDVFASALCRVDVVVLCGGAVELVAAAGAPELREEHNRVFDVLTVLGALRLLRLLKATAHSSTAVEVLLASLVASLRACLPLLGLVVVVLCAFAIVAMQTMGGAFAALPTSNRPRAHFDDFLWSMLTVFQVATTEDWPEVMESFVQALGPSVIVFFLAVIIVVHFVLMSLFAAVLLAVFTDRYGQGVGRAAEHPAAANDDRPQGAPWSSTTDDGAGAPRSPPALPASPASLRNSDDEGPPLVAAAGSPVDVPRSGLTAGSAPPPSPVPSPSPPPSPPSPSPSPRRRSLHSVVPVADLPVAPMETVKEPGGSPTRFISSSWSAALASGSRWFWRAATPPQSVMPVGATGEAEGEMDVASNAATPGSGSRGSATPVVTRIWLGADLRSPQSSGPGSPSIVLRRALASSAAAARGSKLQRSLTAPTRAPRKGAKAYAELPGPAPLSPSRAPSSARGLGSDPGPPPPGAEIPPKMVEALHLTGAAAHSSRPWLRAFDQLAAESAFRRFDVDGDGVLVGDEVVAMLSSAATELPVTRLQYLLTEVTGVQDHVVSFEAFALFWEHKRRLEAQAAGAGAGDGGAITWRAGVPERLASAGQMARQPLESSTPARADACCGLSSSSRLRRAARDMVRHRAFDAVLIIAIVASSVSLVVEQRFRLRARGEAPLPDDERVLRAVAHVDVVVGVVFWTEVVLKAFASGWVGYLRQPWHCFDVTMAAIATVTLPPWQRVAGGVNVRLVRPWLALRPLRLASRVDGLRALGRALARALPHVGLLAAVGCVVLLIVAMAGVRLLGGTFGRCVDGEGGLLPPDLDTAMHAAAAALRQAALRRGVGAAPASGRATGVPAMAMAMATDRARCEALGVIARARAALGEGSAVEVVSWVIPQPNFDSVGAAGLALLQMASLEGWPAILYNAVDSTGVDMQPRRDATRQAFYWPAAFVIFAVFACALVATNLVVGVIFEHFARLRRAEEGMLPLSDAQREWVQTQRKLLKESPQPFVDEPTRPGLRRTCFRLSRRRAWARWRGDRARRGLDGGTGPRRPPDPADYHGDEVDAAMLAVAVAAVVALASRHAGEAPVVAEVRRGVLLFVAGLLAVEAAVGILGMGFRAYTRRPWHALSMVICSATMAAEALRRTGPPALEPLAVALGAAPALLALRLARRVTGVGRLASTLRSAVAPMAHAGVFLTVVVFAFAVAGVEFFGTVPQALLPARGSFATVEESLLLLVVFTSGDQWAAYLWNLRAAAEEGALADWGAEWVVAYFVAFIVVVSLVLVAVVCAVLVEAFDKLRDQAALEVQTEDVRAFAREWALYDPLCTHFAAAEDLAPLLAGLAPPLVPSRLGQNPRRAAAFAAELAVPVRGGRVHYAEVILCLADRICGERLPEAQRHISDRMALQWVQCFPSLRSLPAATAQTSDPAIRARLLSRLLANGHGAGSRPR